MISWFIGVTEYRVKNLKLALHKNSFLTFVTDFFV